MSPSWKEYRKQGKVAPDDDLKKLGLLVVDDEAAIVDALSEMFDQTFDIYAASSAAEALELFKMHAPKIVVTDQRMPEVSGLELLERIVDINPDTVRILVTGYSDINVVIKALNDGLVWKYVTKPWDHEELRKLVIRGARDYLKQHGLDENTFAFSGFLGF